MTTTPAAARCPSPLFEGPLDVVGDVHGELAALNALLGHLGYDSAGQHPSGRRLVFVGDLCDRGPDSPGVVELVRRLVGAGRAQCLLGNHELNVLRGSAKHGNGWFFPDDHDRREGHFFDCAPASSAQRDDFREFFATLPLALSRADLRVVHAAWHEPSLVALAAQVDALPVVDIYRHYQARTEAEADGMDLRRRMADEYKALGAKLNNRHASVGLQHAIGLYDEMFQMRNPLRVVTSGVEKIASAAFFASGKWRMVTRQRWWQQYHDETPVIFGHYWRWRSLEGRERYSRGEPDLFPGEDATTWLGPAASAYCVDFSVGVRYRERPLAPGGAFLGSLAAVRWPERELVFDDGERRPLAAPDHRAGRGLSPGPTAARG
jgi:hypothetical protein